MGRPRVADEDKVKPNDRLKCEICGGTYTRAHKNEHIRTKIHLIYKNMDEDVRMIILNKDAIQEEKTSDLENIIYNQANRRVQKKIRGKSK